MPKPDLQETLLTKFAPRTNGGREYHTSSKGLTALI